MELQAAILLVVSFALLLMFSVPVSYSIVASAFITITAFLTPQFGMFVSAQKVIAGIDSLSLIAVPFFILAGLLMSNGGIAHRLVDLAMLVLRRVPGALALTNAAGNAMFGSISGSGIAAATAIGGVMLPMEKEEGYDEGFSAAMNVATAPVGQLIPPTSIYRLLHRKWRHFRCNPVYGWMDSRSALDCRLHGRWLFHRKEIRLCP